MRGTGHEDVPVVLQVPGNKADVVPCERLRKKNPFCYSSHQIGKKPLHPASRAPNRSVIFIFLAMMRIVQILFLDYSNKNYRNKSIGFKQLKIYPSVCF
jgi:hypothetical protein